MEHRDLAARLYEAQFLINQRTALLKLFEHDGTSIAELTEEMANLGIPDFMTYAVLIVMGLASPAVVEYFDGRLRGQ